MGDRAEWVALCCVVLTAAVPFLSSWDGELVLDDDRAIRDNPDLRPENPLVDLFVNDFWGTPLWSNASHKSYRPVTVLSFRATYAFVGLSTPLYHVGNILCHVVSSCLLFRSLRVLGIVRTTQARLAACLLFAAHPAKVENVASIVGRADVLCAVFWLLALEAYCSRAAGKWRGAWGGVQSWLWLFVAFCFHLLATLSKEVGITVLAVAAAHDLLLNTPLLQCWRGGSQGGWGGAVKRTFVAAVW
eukprot:Hpha_TRINITY_DN18427_c0_g1::TRINITY_DN18427_c0_g1_i1::g.165504::m.165504